MLAWRQSKLLVGTAVFASVSATAVVAVRAVVSPAPAAAPARPLKIEPIVPRVESPLTPAATEALTNRLWPRTNDSIGGVLHGLRTFAPDDNPPTPTSPTFAELRAVLTQHSAQLAWYGSSSLVQTRHGIRFVNSDLRTPRKESQGHTDQCLAVLGELGMPLDEPIQTPTGPVPLRSMLDDTVANFDLHQEEIEWSAAAITLYLPPQRSWRNRHGQTLDFDALAKELMHRPLELSSCGGTHTLFTLALLFRADRVHPVLTDGVRADLSTLLRETVRSVVTGQLPDGSFSPHWYFALVNAPWYRGISRADELDPALLARRQWYGKVTDGNHSRTQHVLATGHHLEWMFLLPTDMQPDPAVVARVAGFLATALREATDDQLRTDYCPYSHAARQLRLLTRRAADR